MTSMLLALAAATTVGLAVSRFFTRGLARSERAAWALASGLLIHAALYTAGILLGLSPGPRKLLLAEAVVLAAAILVRRRGAGRMRDRQVPARGKLSVCRFWPRQPPARFCFLSPRSPSRSGRRISSPSGA